LLAFSVFTPVEAPAQNLNISGEWEVILRAPTGTYVVKAALKQVGELFSGPVTGDVRAATLQGKVSGTKITAQSQIEYSGNFIPISLTGDISGDTIKGVASFGGFPGQWTARRIGALAASKEEAQSRKVGAEGAWNLEVRTTSTTSYPALVLKQEGGTLTGRCTAAYGEAIVSGSVKGREIVFALRLPTWDADAVITYIGVLTGDAMSGAVRLGEAGAGTWTASRLGLKPGRRQ
jgi:hypothetical protein